MDNNQRQCLVPFSELLDRLTVDQIKVILTGENREDFLQEIEKISHDIDLLLTERQIDFSARYIRLLIILAQINLHIWHTKEVMIKDPGQFDDTMKLAHQINGIRNQVKNCLMDLSGYKNPSGKKTNINTDNLKGWNISL